VDEPLTALLPMMMSSLLNPAPVQLIATGWARLIVASAAQFVIVDRRDQAGSVVEGHQDAAG
jgi:hypothetical protein